MARTKAGRDFMARVMGNGAHSDAGTGDMAPADYMALSTSNDPPDEDNTSLPDEITVGTLARAQATYAHTEGQASYTLTHTFTSDDTVTIRKVGVFNAPSGGTLVFEGLLDEVAVLTPSDQVIITYTITL